MEKASRGECPVMSTARPSGEIALEVRRIGRRCMAWRDGTLAGDAPQDAGYRAPNGAAGTRRTFFEG